MGNPTNMIANAFSALKGWPNPHGVDFVAPLDPSVTSVLPNGSCVHLSSTLTFLPGVGNLSVMPMFTIQGSQDPDVLNANFGTGTNASNAATVAGNFVPVAPSGNMSALVAVGGLELVTSNYDTTQVYPPNTHLTSPVTQSGPVSPGMLTPGTIAQQTIVGVVSRGVMNGAYGPGNLNAAYGPVSSNGYYTLAFWPHYIPAAV